MAVKLAIQKEEIGKITGQGQPRQKVHKIPIPANKKLDVEVPTCHPSSKGSVNRKTTVQTNLGINREILCEKYFKENGLRHGSTGRAPA
jgi:hypothetical protein